MRASTRPATGLAARAFLVLSAAVMAWIVGASAAHAGTAATASAHCTGRLVADGDAHRLELNCPGGVARLSATFNATLTSVGPGRRSAHGLRCSLVRRGKQPVVAFSCAAAKPQEGKISVPFDVATVPNCGLIATVTSATKRGGPLGRGASLAEAGAKPCDAAPGGSGSAPAGASTPAPSPLPTPSTPSPIVNPVATPAPDPGFGDHAYAITYHGDSTYSFHRHNDWVFLGTYADYTATQTLGWTTTFQPIELGPKTADGAQSDGSDTLTGTRATHDVVYAIDSLDRHCSASAGPTDKGDNPPVVSVRRVNATNFELTLGWSNVPAYPGSCDDGNHPDLYPFDQDGSDPETSLTTTVEVTQAQLDGAPFTLNVSSPSAQAHVDCADPDLSLTVCQSSFVWNGTVTFARAPGD